MAAFSYSTAVWTIFLMSFLFAHNVNARNIQRCDSDDDCHHLYFHYCDNSTRIPKCTECLYCTGLNRKIDDFCPKNITDCEQVTANLSNHGQNVIEDSSSFWEIFGWGLGFSIGVGFIVGVSYLICKCISNKANGRTNNKETDGSTAAATNDQPSAHGPVKYTNGHVQLALQAHANDNNNDSMNDAPNSVGNGIGPKLTMDESVEAKENK